MTQTTEHLSVKMSRSLGIVAAVSTWVLGHAHPNDGIVMTGPCECHENWAKCGSGYDSRFVCAILPHAAPSDDTAPYDWVAGYAQTLRRVFIGVFS